MTSITYYKAKKIHHTSKRGFSTKREAQKYEYEFRLQLEKPLVKGVLYSDALKSFISDKKSSRRKSTFGELNRISSTYFSSLNDFLVHNIRTSDYQSIKNSLVERDLSISYKNKILSIMKSISRFVSAHYETIDYAKVITGFKDHSTKKEFNTWTPDELKYFLGFVDREVYYDLFYILYFTGARLGEIRALYKSDCPGGTMSITKSIRRETDGVTTPKNKFSVRKISLDTKTDLIIQKHASLEGLYLLGNDHPLSQTSVDREFKKYLDKACNEDPKFKRMRVHDFRHSHATLLINRGANIVAVSKRLGHANVQQTLKTYTHLLKENEDLALSILNIAWV
jgi:integrase